MAWWYRVQPRGAAFPGWNWRTRGLWPALLLVALMAALGTAEQAEARRLRGEYRVNFEGGGLDNRNLRLVGPGAAQVLAASDEGLRIQIPGGSAGDELGIAPRFTIGGDFEITAAYRIVDVPEPDGGYGVGPGVYLMLASEENLAASLSRVRRIEEGEVYSAHAARDVPEGSGSRRQHSVQLEPADAEWGRLRIERNGDVIRYLVAEGDAVDFRPIREAELGPGDVTLARLALVRNGATMPAEILWTDFSVRAERLHYGHEGSVQVAVAAAIVLLLAAGATVVAWRFRRRPVTKEAAASP